MVQLDHFELKSSIPKDNKYEIKKQCLLRWAINFNYDDLNWLCNESEDFKEKSSKLILAELNKNKIISDFAIALKHCFFDLDVSIQSKIYSIAQARYQTYVTE